LSNASKGDDDSSNTYGSSRTGASGLGRNTDDNDASTGAFGTTSGGNRRNDAFESGSGNDSRRNEDSYGETGGDSKVGKLMEKAGQVFKSDKLQERGQEKRGGYGDDEGTTGRGDNDY